MRGKIHEREVRRRKGEPVTSYSGHKVKSLMTVIILWWSAICDVHLFLMIQAGTNSVGFYCISHSNIPATEALYFGKTFNLKEDYAMAIFDGAGVALVTPMKANGDVNYEKLGELVEMQIAGGTDALIVCGTTGEASTLTHEEHLECISVVSSYTKKRVPIIAGTGSNCTSTAIYLSDEAKKRGADGLLLVSPYYNKATQNGLKQHFLAIAEIGRAHV